MSINKNIINAINALPHEIKERSGGILYTGKEAFSGNKPVYILGLNPGGNPDHLQHITVDKHTRDVLSYPSPWSEYTSRWGNRAPGESPMQKRILHLLMGISLDPCLTPASNVIFTRSRNEYDLRENKDDLLQLCWPVHQAVIENLNTRVIICFGRTTGHWVRKQLKADNLIHSYTENNNRHWTSTNHRTYGGIQVLTLTHPSWANWCNQNTDPTILVKQALRDTVYPAGN